MDWRIREVFEQALDLEPHERAAFVEEACGDDADLRREIEAMLAAPALVATRILTTVDAAAPGAAAPGAARLATGTIVAGKYRIDGVIGAGGMGAVYRATHLQLERAVALKGVRAELLEDPTAAERFRREAVAVARLRHPHIVTVHDYGVAPEVGAYLVMELLEGRSLREELRESAPLDLPTALAIAAQVCAAVGAAHQAGVIHRDVKPENIFLERRDGAIVAKVVDFGLAKMEAALRSVDGTLTHEGALLGTPLYMSPEQCRGEEVDARSDVYSLGCVLYEMLTGAPPFNGKTVWALLYQHVNDPPLPPSELMPDLPPEVDEALLRALEKRPDDRYQTVEALAAALGVPSVAGLQAVSPPVARGPVNNLPHALTSFVGRERQIDEVREWLAKARLVTLVGPGGIGKTRLALETAARVAGEYEDGAWLVELASLADPALVARAVGSTLGVRAQAGRSDVESLEAWLRDRRVLLVLDNCEHLVAACATLIERLLAASAELRVLATSQESLAVAGEATWPVPGLGLPERNAGPESEAVRLFAERATLARPGFEVTEANAAAAAELCRRLEGIPLAIELAAARVRALSVAQILERLDDRFRLLAGTNRGRPTRQQTLRAALDWSYGLLTEEERGLLQRLSVFAGGWTLEAAEAVGDAPFTLDLLFRLVDKSLVIAQEQGPEGRYRMLEVVRMYALERLRESGAEADVARRHAEVFLGLAEVARMQLGSARGAEWLARLEAEHDNMRAALAWLYEHAPGECLSLAVGISEFWSLRGHFREGLRWLSAALERSGSSPLLLRVKASRSAGELAWRKGDLTVARAHLEESMRMAREAGDASQIGWSAFHLALVIQQQGDPQASCPYLEESLERGRALGDDRLVGNALNSLGEAARIEGDWERARPFYEQSLEIHRRMGHPVGISLTLCNLGAALCDAGEVAAAHVCYLEALPSLRELGNSMGLSLALDGLAAVAVRRREWEQAARFVGAAAALREEIGGELEPADRSLRERCLRELREHFDEPALEAAMADGRAAPDAVCREAAIHH